jgi:putative ABC transport system permease protein
MIHHVFNLIWRRKRANALLIIELLATFLILFCLASFSLHLLRLYRIPLGFNVANTWSVEIATGAAWAEADGELFRQVLSVVKQLDEVVTAETLSDAPFALGRGSSGDVEIRDVYINEVEINAVSDGLPEALGMRLLEGRWFGPEDEGQSARPVVINRAMKDALGEEGVLGAMIPNGPTQQQRVVGIFEEFRQHGEFSSIMPVMLQRQSSEYFQAPLLVLVVKPEVSAGFEEQLLATLQRAAPGWDFDVNSWTSLQQSHFRTYTIPLLIVAAVVLFLLTMVGFGLLGVLWQNVIRRTPEMGLRRAMGATANAVRLQVVLELLAVASLALVLGFIIVVQFPLAGIIQALDWGLFVPAVTISTLILLLLCILFALYPSYQATRQDPVEALRYE